MKVHGASRSSTLTEPTNKLRCGTKANIMSFCKEKICRIISLNGWLRQAMAHVVVSKLSSPKSDPAVIPWVATPFDNRSHKVTTRSSASIGGRTVRKADSLGGFTVKTRPGSVGGQTARTARRNCTDSVAGHTAQKSDTVGAQTAIAKTKSRKSAAQDPGTQAHFPQNKEYVWTCNLCGWEARAPTWRARTRGRTNHKYRAHADTPSDRVASLKKPRQIFVCDIPWHLRAWTCAKCRLGIAKEWSHSAIYEAAQKHLENCSQLTMRQNRAQLSAKQLTRVKMGYTCNTTKENSMKQVGISIVMQWLKPRATNR